jgi:hypothetical protein
VDGSGLHTTTGSLLGTPAYLSPEQLRGQEADARTDQHAVGVVLFEMLTGARPWRSHAIELLVEIAQQVPPLAHELAPHVPPALSSIIARALAKNPSARFANADELRQALAPFATSQLSSSAQVSPDTPTAEVAPSQRGVETVSFALTPGVTPQPKPTPDTQLSTAAPTPQAKRSLLLPILGVLGGLFLLGLTSAVVYLAWLVQRPVPIAAAVDAQAAAAATPTLATTSSTAPVASATVAAATPSASSPGVRAPTEARAATDSGAKVAAGASAATKPKCSCISQFNTLICQRPMTPICFCEDHGSICPVAFNAEGDCPTNTNFGAFKGATLKTGDTCSGFKKENGSTSVPATGTLKCNLCYGHPTEPAVPNTACEGLMQGADSPTSKVDKTGLWICKP